jgi:hypothetical protein
MMPRLLFSLGHLKGTLKKHFFRTPQIPGSSDETRQGGWNAIDLIGKTNSGEGFHLWMRRKTHSGTPSPALQRGRQKDRKGVKVLDSVA